MAPEAACRMSRSGLSTHSWINRSSIRARGAEWLKPDRARRNGADMGRTPLQPNPMPAGDAIMSSPALHTTRRASTGRARYAAFGAVARLAALVLIVSLCRVSLVAAQDKPASELLRIAVSDTGRMIFDGLVEDINAQGDPQIKPDIKYTSSLGSLREFCKGIGADSPDAALTTRRMQSVIASECSKNGVNDFITVELGRGPVVLAVRSGSLLSRLTSRQIYLALARDVPEKDEFHRNTSIRWSDIDRSLPPQDIRFQLPPRKDGSRSIFDALILESGCRQEPLVKQIYSAEQRVSRCVSTRVDRIREIPPGQAVRELLEAPEGTVGVLSYFDIQQSGGRLVGLALDGVSPGRDEVLKGRYEYYHSYWLYVKRGRADRGGSKEVDAAVECLTTRAASEAIVGPDGVLPKLGLVPLPADERAAQRAALAAPVIPPGITAVMDRITTAVADAWNLLGESTPVDAMAASDFTMLMDIAGYKTQEFQTTIGVIPGIGMSFGIAREMSKADQEYLERKLALDVRGRPGVLPAIQRQIVRTVLDVSEAEGYEISKVEIEIVPLPSVKLIVAPTDAPISFETTTILRAIEQLSERVSGRSR
jgi:phosphate transport system substrate-binding protein